MLGAECEVVVPVFRTCGLLTFGLSSYPFILLLSIRSLPCISFFNSVS